MFGIVIFISSCTLSTAVSARIEYCLIEIYPHTLKMYLRPVHSAFHLPNLYSFLKCNPLGVLTSSIPFADNPTIQSSHIPWVLDPPDDLDPSDHEQPEAHDTTSQLDASIRAEKGEALGTLRAHMARANPHAKALIAAARIQVLGVDATEITEDSQKANLPDGGVTLPDEVLVLFTGPIQHYVTPKFYTATKPATGKVVPTWNYEAVQAYGRITVYPSTTSTIAETFLTNAIVDLTHQSELSMEYDGQDGRSKEWRTDDAPDRFIGLLKKSIVGISVEITRLGGIIQNEPRDGWRRPRRYSQGF